MTKNTILFENTAKEEILSFFNKVVNKEGFIVEKGDRRQKVLAEDGTFIELQEFAGIENGSEIFIKSDIVSLIKLSDRLK